MRTIAVVVTFMIWILWSSMRNTLTTTDSLSVVYYVLWCSMENIPSVVFLVLSLLKSFVDNLLSVMIWVLLGCVSITVQVLMCVWRNFCR